jgi:hypothetical protein
VTRSHPRKRRPYFHAHPKKVGFLSVGAWHPGGGMARSATDALRQTVETRGAQRVVRAGAGANAGRAKPSRSHRRTGLPAILLLARAASRAFATHGA